MQTLREPTDRPNVILINCDDLGYGDLGCYGSEVNSTPALDRMAGEGLRLTDFYMASPVCSPSRGAMLTGCYPPRIGFGRFQSGGVLFPGDPDGLNPDERTIATLLKDRGYATKLVGKWHCGDQPEFLPTRHGFDSYFGLPYSNDMGRQTTRTHFPPLPLVEDESVIQQQPDQSSLTERYVEHSVRFMRANRDRPFFLYLAHMHVHLPHYPPQRFLRTSRNGRYGAAVECIDWAAGAILHELKELGLDQNTLVIFTSDNGSRHSGEGGSNLPLRGGKGSTWEGGMRLPCILRWPGVIEPGRASSELVTSMDFLPTIAELAGAEPPRDRVIDGKPVTPILRGEPDAKSPHEAFFYYKQNNLEAVRVGRWKLHVAKNDKAIEELYDLEADVGETENLYAEKADVAAECMAHIERMRAELGDDRLEISGSARRPVGLVSDPKPLCEYDPTHPYFDAEYDLSEAG